MFTRSTSNVLYNWYLTDILDNQNLHSSFHKKQHDKIPCMVTHDKDENITIMALVPGATKEDIDITFKENSISITNQGQPYKISNNDTVLYGDFVIYAHATITVYDVDKSKIEATLENGVLKLFLPKKQDNSTKIEI